jgi:ABC-2 type transport system permease protein
MGGTITAEFRKLFTTRLWWGMAIGVFIAGAGLAGLFAAIAGRDFGGGGGGGRGQVKLDPLQTATNVYVSGLSIAYLMTLAIGVMAIGAEYRHKTITSTFLATPRRVRVMVAKVVSLLGSGAFYGLVFVVGSVGVGATVLSLRSLPAFPETGPILRTLALSLLVLGLWALIGLGAGILIPNQVAALLVAIGVAWIVEPIAGVVLNNWSWGADIARFFPSQASGAIVQSVSGTPGAHPLTWWGGALVLVAYAAVLAGVGSALTVRRDVT